MKKAFITVAVILLLVAIGITSSAIAGADGCPSPSTDPSPTNGSKQISIYVNLSWSACSNASYYNVNFSTSATPTHNGTTNNSSYQLPQLSYNTTYYWKIEPCNISCNTSWPVWNFSTAGAPPPTPTPTLIPTPTPTPTSTLCTIPAKPQTPSPTNGSPNNSITIPLSWDASADASYYEVFFGTSESPGYFDSTYNNSYQFSTPHNISTKYYWKVIAKSICGFCSSDIWNFTTECPVPAKPQNTSPRNDSDQIAIYDTYLSWNNSTGASLYDIYFGTSAKPTYQGNTSNSSYQLPQLNQSTTYYWQVVARNACGNNSSDIWNFATGCPVAVRPKTPSPANGSTETSTSILLSWNASANASYYEVFFGTSESPNYFDSTDNNSYQFPSLNISTKYYWKVVAKSACDMNSSDIWNFTTGCPVPKPQNPSPVNGSDQISIYPYLSWNASANASLFNAVFFDI